jgi:transcriptional regulator with XRE-family HTH domain
MKPTRQVKLRVRELAAERGMDDYEVASQARMNVNVIRRMFTNQQVAELKINQLARVAEVLKVPTSALFLDE